MKAVVVMEILWWTSIIALAYTVIGYPLLLAALSRLRPRPEPCRSINSPLPNVSLIITAHNEERDLTAKLENSMGLDYPPHKLEVIVASDCSTDGTDDIVRGFMARNDNPFNVHLHRQPQRTGKTATQNAAVELAQGDVLVFSDATSRYDPAVLRAIIPNFADPQVGCVAGRLLYIDPAHSDVGRGACSYWGYETFLKDCESRIGSLIGVSGCLYAVRRSAYVPLYREACSDFLIATIMVEQRLRAVYEPAALCIEATNKRSDEELQMRVRIVAQTLSDLWRHRAMMNPLRSGFFAIQLISHKVLRYMVPLFLLGCLVSSISLASQARIYAAVLAAQILFYALAVAGWLLERVGVRGRLLSLPLYFVLTNLASLIAFYHFGRGECFAQWMPIRDSTPIAVATIPNGAGD